jgi:hypothetical protein
MQIRFSGKHRVAEIDEEKEKWLPERHKEVAALKDELKNAESWAPTPETVKKSTEGGS